AFICRGSNHCNRVVPGRDIASRTQCREETRHALQYFDLRAVYRGRPPFGARRSLRGCSDAVSAVERVFTRHNPLVSKSGRLSRVITTHRVAAVETGKFGHIDGAAPGGSTKWQAGLETSNDRYWSASREPQRSMTSRGYDPRQSRRSRNNGEWWERGGRTPATGIAYPTPWTRVGRRE